MFLTVKQGAHKRDGGRLEMPGQEKRGKRGIESAFGVKTG
jgi:hypothetical protein